MLRYLINFIIFEIMRTYPNRRFVFGYQLDEDAKKISARVNVAYALVIQSMHSPLMEPRKYFILPIILSYKDCKHIG